jgi:hypothetical protein
MQRPICKRILAAGAICLHIGLAGLAVLAADGDTFQPIDWLKAPQQIAATGRNVSASASAAVETFADADAVVLPRAA